MKKNFIEKNSKEDHARALGDLVSIINDFFLCVYGMKLCHVCYTTKIPNAEQDIVYLDFPYNESSDMFAEYLSVTPELEVINKQIIELFTASKEGVNYIYYEYSFIEGVDYAVYEVLSNLDSKNNYNLMRQYLPIVDSSVYLSTGYLFGTKKQSPLDIELNSRISCRKLITFCDEIDSAFGNVYNITTVIFYSIAIPSSQSIERCLEVIPKIKRMLILYFNSPIISIQETITNRAIESTTKEKKQLETQVDSFAHIMFNLSGGIMSDVREIGGNENIKKRIAQLGLCLKILGSRHGEVHEDILALETLEHIIRSFEETFVLSSCEKIEIIIEEIELSKIDVNGKQTDLLLLMWNLLSNCDKYNCQENRKKENIRIQFKKGDNGSIVFIFTNLYSKEEHRRTLKSILVERKPNLKKGMGSILEVCEKYEWQITLEEPSDDQFNQNSVSLCIKTTLKQSL